MKSSMIRLISLLLVAVMCLGALIACNNKEEETVATDTNVSTEQTEDIYDANGYLKDDLPVKEDYNGKEMNIYLWADQKNWEFVDTSKYPTALLDQALYKRQVNVESRFNIKINLITEKGSWNDRNTFVQKLANNVQVGDGAYDAVGQYTPSVGIAASQGLYKDLQAVENINTEKPWWPKHALSTSMVSGKVYSLTGDISTTLIRNVECMFVNTTLYESYNIAQFADGRSIYDVVRDYDWTLETMNKLALGHVGSNEGLEDDQKMYGLSITNHVSADGFFYSGGFKMVEDKDGKITLSDDLSKLYFVDWFDAVRKIYDGRTYQDVYSKDSGGYKLFETDRSIFHVGNVSESQTLAQKGVSFTILPMPMRNKDQGAYYTCAGMWVTMYSVPVDVKDSAMSGLLIEALASEAYRTVTETVYYDLFQNRYNSGGNEDSAEMFDIVSDSVVFDTSRIFADSLKCFSQFRDTVVATDDKASWTGNYAANSGTWKKNITSLISQIG